MTNGSVYRKAGMWRDLTLGYHLREAVARSPEKTAVVAVRADRPEPRRLTVRAGLSTLIIVDYNEKPAAA